MSLVAVRLHDDDFIRVQAMMLEYAGITLAISKKQMAENRLSRALRSSEFNDFSSYLSNVSKNGVLKQGFINAMTTNVTSFYREPHHFKVLSLTFDQTFGKTRVTPLVWSAGCSTGEEAISILFTVLDVLDDSAINTVLAKAKPFILATDVDTAVLNQAQIARFTAAQVVAIPPRWLARAFEYSADQHYLLRSEFKQLIKFQALNLNSPLWNFPAGFSHAAFDAIFCRNVMIYFNAQTQRTLLQKFTRVMHERSLLFSGHSEMLLHSNDLFESLGGTAYKLNAKDQRGQGL